MPPVLLVLARRQHGLVTRLQCYESGLTDEDLRVLLRPRGGLAVVRRGVYADREWWDAIGDVHVRAALTDRAASLVMETEHVLSHDSAARALGVQMLRPRRELVHVTRPGVGGSRTKAGVKHHLTRIDLDVRTAGGLPVTGPARTALDIAREHGLQPGVVALDQVLARGVRRSEVEQELAVMWSWPHVRTARAALDLADAGAESPAETLGRLLVVGLALGVVETQFPVVCEGRLFWSDLRIGCQLIEVEGVTKLVPAADGGLASGSTFEAVRAREGRGRLLRAEGLGLAYLGWDDMFGRLRPHTERWLTREILLTNERYGTVLPAHLAEQAARIRRDHPWRRPR